MGWYKQHSSFKTYNDQKLFGKCIFWISGNFGGFVFAGPLRASGLIVLSGLCVLSMKMCDAI